MRKMILRFTLFLLLITSFAFIFIKFYFPVKYKNEITKTAVKYNVEPELIFAMARVESNFREDVVSKKGAIGILQILPTTAKWFQKKNKIKYDSRDLYDYKKNIEIGTSYYKYLYDEFHDTDKAIAAYNAGPGRVKDGNWENIGETKRYVMKVKMFAEIYKIILSIDN